MEELKVGSRIKLADVDTVDPDMAGIQGTIASVEYETGVGFLFVIRLDDGRVVSGYEVDELEVIN